MDAVTPLFARVLIGLATICARIPYFVMGIYLVLVVGAVFLTTQYLGFRVHRDDMIHENHPVQVAWKSYLALNGPDDDLVAVVEGGTPEQITKAIDRLAQEFRARPASFDRILDRVDPASFRDKALQFLPAEKLRTIEQALIEMRPLFELPFGWNLFTLQSLALEAKTRMRRIALGTKVTAGDRQFLEGFGNILETAATTLVSPSSYVSPWKNLRPEGFDGQISLDQPTYFFNKDKSLGFLTVRPKPDPLHLMTPYYPAVQDALHLVEQIRHEFPMLSLGLTGLPALECAEMEASQNDTTRASWMALAAVFVLYLVVFRGLRVPLLTIIPLITGTVLALGLTTLTIGHLNLLSATFALMLIGVGDYGILWISRFDQEYQQSGDPDLALRRTAGSTGLSIAFAAITMAIAFGATTFADFQAVAELGFIAGMGTLLCGLTSLTLLPALSATFFASPTPTKANESNPYTIILPIKRPEIGVPILSAKWLIPAGALVVAMIPLLFHLRYDSNLLHLQNQNLQSVYWQNRLLEKCPQASWHAVVVAKDAAMAIGLAEKLKNLPEVASVAETASLNPEESAERQLIIQRLQIALGKLPPRNKPLPIAAISPARLLGDVRQFRVWLDSEEAGKREIPASSQVAAGLELVEIALVEPSSTLTKRLVEFDNRVVGDLIAQLHDLRDCTNPKPLVPADLPENLLERFQAKGHYFLRVFPAMDTWDYDGIKQFTNAVSKVAPTATGKPFTTRLGLEQMKSSFVQAAIYAFLAILVVIFLELRSIGLVLLALLPLITGILLSLGFMSWLGISLNPANMIGLPLLVGIGIDNGLHLVHDYKGQAGAYRLDPAMFRGISIASATTALGFACLVTSSHQGLASLGMLLTAGVVSCSFCALLLLPAVFRLLTRDATLAIKESTQPSEGLLERAA